MIKVHIITYGCAASQDDSDIIKGLVNKECYKLRRNINRSDIVVVVTCIVKGKTESKIISKIKEITGKYPNKKLIIAGCMPEAEYEICKKIAPNASLINTQHIKDIIKVIKNKDKVVEFLGKREENKLNLPKLTKDKNVVNIQIAEGCLGNCLFCITKLAKGNLHSFFKEDILKEIKTRLKQGYKRINLTSTDNGCYGFDIGTNLPDLLKKIVSIKSNFKVRVGMMNPEHVLKYLDELIGIYKNKKIIKFLHIPVQSFSDKVLRDMDRNYTYKDFKKIVTKFRKEIPKINIATDLIVGYPSEGKKDFNLTLKRLKEIKPEVLNISKFSSRPGTKAGKLKQLKSQEVKKRSREISRLWDIIKKKKRII